MDKYGMLLRGATVINPGGESGQLDIEVNNGLITAIGSGLNPGKGFAVRDERGKFIFPAFIDLHVHLREPGQTHKEDVFSGAQAAHKGGFAAVAAMPNTQPVIDSPELVDWLRSQGESQDIEIMPVAALSCGLAGKCLTDIEALARAGAVAFSDDGLTLADSALMREALIRCRDLSRPVFQHSEDPLLSGKGQVDPGALALFDSPLLPLPGSAEDVIVARDIALQNETGGHLHVTHLSTLFSAEMVAFAKERGQNVSSDVTPHHLLLNYNELSRSGSLAKMKPPLRSEADRRRLVSMLADGLIDCVATDHAPHASFEKDQAFIEAPFGIIGMETAFPLLYDRLVRSGSLPLNRLVEAFTTGAARVIGQEYRLGVLAVGMPANLVIFDTEKQFTVGGDYFRSKSRNSPFIGWTGYGVIKETIISGVTRFKDGL